jgi:DNA-binding IclR family transcriptional regulator
MSCIMTDKDDAPEDAAPESSVKGAQTLMRALDILDEVIDRPIRAADLARKLGMNRTTAHRLAHALRTRDYLSVTPEGFALGPKLLQLGVLASEQTDYLRVARPGWRRCRRTRVSASSSATARATGHAISTASPGASVCAWRRRRATAARSRKRVWARRCCSTTPRRAGRSCGSRPHAEPVTDEEIAAFLERMRRYKAEGLVRHDSELGDGVRSIAAPVRNAHGAVVVAISIASAASYLTDDIIDDLAARVKHCADEVSAALGWRPAR